MAAVGDCRSMNGKHYLEWDGGEKFYEYVKWLEYVIKYIFKGWGLKADWRD